MAIPRSSADYYRRQQRILATLLLAVRRSWRRMDPSARWSEQYVEDGVGRQLLMLVGAAQVAAARDADNYIATVLAELAVVPDAEPAMIVPSAFAGAAGDGRPVETLLGLAVPRAGRSFNARRRAFESSDTSPKERPEGMSHVAWESLLRAEAARQVASQAFDVQRAAQEALAEVGQWLEAVAASIIIDTARAAESAATTAHPEVSGYVRMLNPPSCSRCVVLAGRWYRWNEGFDRHPPTCDCRHIPASEAIAGDLTVNPDAYFWSLSRAEQDRVFTKVGAQAIRDGADIGQVVNARRGMSTAQQNPRGWIPKGRLAPVEIGGRPVFITTEGTTKFGRAHRGRTGRNMSARLMPESIYEVAEDRADALRMLKLHGYIT